LQAGFGNAFTCEFTNTVQSCATPELLDFLGKQGIGWTFSGRRK
jgi:hypothetical protein